MMTTEFLKYSPQMRTPKAQANGEKALDAFADQKAQSGFDKALHAELGKNHDVKESCHPCDKSAVGESMFGKHGKNLLAKQPLNDGKPEMSVEVGFEGVEHDLSDEIDEQGAVERPVTDCKNETLSEMLGAVLEKKPTLEEKPALKEKPEEEDISKPVAKEAGVIADYKDHESKAQAGEDDASPLIAMPMNIGLNMLVSDALNNLSSPNNLQDVKNISATLSKLHATVRSAMSSVDEGGVESNDLFASSLDNNQKGKKDQIATKSGFNLREDKAGFGRAETSGIKPQNTQADVAAAVKAGDRDVVDHIGLEDAHQSQGGDNAKASAPRLNMADLALDGNKAQMTKPLEIGDRLQMKAETAGVMQESRIQGVEVISNRKVGDLRILHVQLTPDDLGTVDARMRMTGEGLHIELTADKADTARLLAADHRMLSKTLEKSGFHDDGRISITVIERGSHTVHASSNAGQASDQAFGNSQSGQNGQNGQGYKSDAQDASQSGAGSGAGQGGRQSSGSGQESRQQVDDVGKTDIKRDNHAPHDPRRLVV